MELSYFRLIFPAILIPYIAVPCLTPGKHSVTWNYHLTASPHHHRIGYLTASHRILYLTASPHHHRIGYLTVSPQHHRIGYFHFVISGSQTIFFVAANIS